MTRSPRNGEQRTARRAGARVLLAVGLVLAIVATSVTATWISLYRQNTLLRNGRWASSKVELDRGVIAAVATLTTRAALLGERLDLGAWHGFQEFLYVEPLDFRELSFTAELTDGAYLALRLDAGGELVGLRLGRHERFPSQLYRATPDFAFTQRTPLPGVRPTRGTCRVSRRDDGHLTFELDGRELGSLAGPRGPLRLGFRGGQNQAFVDDVLVYGGGDGGRGEPLLREDFRNRSGAARSVLFWLGVHALAVAAVLGLLRGRRLRFPPLAPVLALSLVELLGVAGVAVVVRSAVPRESYVKIDFAGYPRNIETVDETLERVRAGVSPEPPAGTARLLFVGSSQTWGAGARDAEDVWVRVLERSLPAPEDGDGVRYECINLGLCGKRSGFLLERVRELVPQWRPQLIVVDLSHNDRDPAAFERNLDAFCALGRERGIEVLLVLEPIAFEREDPTVDANHEVVRRVAARNGVTAVDLQAVLDERADEGFLWWDRVHLTSLGQRLFAQALLPEVERALGLR